MSSQSQKKIRMTGAAIGGVAMGVSQYELQQSKSALEIGATRTQKLARTCIIHHHLPSPLHLRHYLTLSLATGLKSPSSDPAASLSWSLQESLEVPSSNASDSCTTPLL